MGNEENADFGAGDLKTARINSGLTLKEWFERTRISVVNLEAMENGHFHLLPVPIYTRNFIKTYAEALGVDSRPLLDRYEKYLQTQQQKEEQIVEEPQEVSLLGLMVRYKAYLWALLIIAVFSGVVLFVSLNHPSGQEKLSGDTLSSGTAATDGSVQVAAVPDIPLSDVGNPPEMEPTSKTGSSVAGQNSPEMKTAGGLAGADAKEAQTAFSESKTDIETLIDNQESRTMVIYATEETWIRIQADDKAPIQVLLKPGERISHRAARFNMDIGNAGGVRIQFDGKNLENLGRTGQVIHLRLP